MIGLHTFRIREKVAHFKPVFCAWFSLVVLMLYSLTIGAVSLPWSMLFHDPDLFQLLMVSRFPRTIAVVIVGSVLGMIGCLSQVVMNNRFAEPTTLGTPQGIVLGLLIGSIWFPQLGLLPQMLLGCATGLVSLMVLKGLLVKLPNIDPLQLPLIGLVYSAILGAAATFIAFEFDRLQTIMVWLNGDFANVIQGRYELLWLAALLGGVSFIGAPYISLLGMGEHATVNLGVPYGRLVFFTMLLIALVTSFVVVTVGMISFLGLMIPNIIRQYLGDNLRSSLPWCAWLGGFSLLLCDVIGRLLISPLELPASVIFGTFAAGMFLVILWRGGDNE